MTPFTLFAALLSVLAATAAGNDCQENYSCSNSHSSGFSDVPTAERSSKRHEFARSLIVRCGEFGYRCNMAKLNSAGDVWTSDGLIRTGDDDQSDCYIQVGPVSAGGNTFQGCLLHGNAQTSESVSIGVSASKGGPSLSTSYSASFVTKDYSEPLNCAVWCGDSEYTRAAGDTGDPDHLLNLGTYMRCKSSGLCEKNSYLKFRQMYDREGCNDGWLGSGVSKVRVWYDTWGDQKSYCYQNIVSAAPPPPPSGGGGGGNTFF